MTGFVLDMFSKPEPEPEPEPKLPPKPELPPLPVHLLDRSMTLPLPKKGKACRYSS